MTHLKILIEKLSEIDGSVSIEKPRGPFSVEPKFEGEKLIGVTVSNLGASKELPIEVFIVTLSLLNLSNDKTAVCGKVMKRDPATKETIAFNLGDPELPMNSVEGHIASVIFGKKIGDTVFRRITPVARILEWAGVCEYGNGTLKLKEI